MEYKVYRVDEIVNCGATTTPSGSYWVVRKVACGNQTIVTILVYKDSNKLPEDLVYQTDVTTEMLTGTASATQSPQLQAKNITEAAFNSLSWNFTEIS
jgi:hypothetical protein